MSKINEVFFLTNLAVGQGNITDIIRSFWEAESQPGDQRKEFEFTEGVDDHAGVLLDYSKAPDTAKMNTTLRYCLSDFHFDFFEICGRFIDELEFVSGELQLPKTFMSQTFRHCVKLRVLYISSIIEQIIYTKVDLTVLDELHINYCVIHRGILEQLSKFLSRVKQLHISKNVYVAGGDFQEPIDENDYGLIDITMPDTKIDKILSDEEASEEILYFKV